MKKQLTVLLGTLVLLLIITPLGLAKAKQALASDLSSIEGMCAEYTSSKSPSGINVNDYTQDFLTSKKFETNN